MPLTLTLDPHGEQLIAPHLRSGRYATPEEVVTHALEILAEKEPASKRKKSPAEAVADIRQLHEAITLGGLKIRNLIDEGRKY